MEDCDSVSQYKNRVTKQEASKQIIFIAGFKCTWGSFFSNLKPISQWVSKILELINYELQLFRLERLFLGHNKPIIWVYDQLSRHWWPEHSLAVRPHGNVVVDEVGEMVGHEVFARDSQIQRVPELKLLLQAIQACLGDACLRERRLLEEDVVPDLWCHLLRPSKGTENRNNNQQVFLGHIEILYSINCILC